MSNTVKLFVKSLFSRNFVAAAGTAGALAYEKQWYPAAACVVAFVAAEAHVDAKRVAKVVAADAPAVAKAIEADIPAVASEVKAAEAVVEPAATALAADLPAAVAADAAVPAGPADASGLLAEAESVVAKLRDHLAAIQAPAAGGSPLPA